MATTVLNPCVVNLSSITPSCRALTSPAGVRDFFYAVRKIDIATITRATDGTVTGITLKPAAKFIRVQGRKFQNSGAVDISKSATGKTNFKQTFNARIYSRTQAERNTLQQFAYVEDLVIFSPNNDDQIEIYGIGIGLSPTSGKGGTGIKLDDDNTSLFTFEGEEPALPPIFNTVAPAVSPGVDDEEQNQIDNIAYLDELVSA
jgi:hypothetical protein